MAATESTYSDLAGQVPLTPHNIIWLNTNPTAGDTLTGGSDIYEFRATATQISNDTYIGVLIGGSAAASRLNFEAAQNGVGTGIADGILAVGGGGPLLVENGTENVLGDGATGYYYVYQADAPGGTKVPGDATSLVFADSLTSSDTWLFNNMNQWDAFGGGPRESVVFSVKVLAQAITNGELPMKLPFIMDSGSIIEASFKDNSSTNVVRDDDISGSGDVVTISFNAGVAPNIQANDTVTITVWQ